MFREKDQVVVRRPLTPWSKTKEVRIGEVVAFADKDTAVVSLPLPGGRTERKEFKISELQPVSEVYGRVGVQRNPVHRQVVVGF